MAQKLKSEREAASIKRAGSHSLGGNLLLQIGVSGSRSWIAKVTVKSGRRRELGLGSCRDVKLAQAREKVVAVREAISAGLDPALALNPVSMPTFEEVAREHYAELAPTYRNKKHSAQWISSMERYAFPKIGNLSVDQVSVADVKAVLSPIWLSKEETARRVLQRVASVIDYAVAMGHRDHELPVRGIRKVLPRQTHRVRHHPACPVDQAPLIYEKLVGRTNCASVNALRFLFLTAARSNEVRGALWEEIDLEAGIWTVPASRMKAHKEHRVALSAEAIELLKNTPRIGEHSGLIFPNSSGKPLSDTAVSKVLKRVAPGFTVHGLRSTFKDWASNKTDHADDVSEAALAHVDPNRVRAAYKRTDLLDKRRALMEDWVTFLRSPSEV